MLPSMSRSQLKFLLDENVKIELLKFLKSEGYNASFKPKGVSNGKLAKLSKSERRVLVTNDSDFANSDLFPKEKVFSIVLLAIPQDKPEAFLEAFSILLNERSKPKDFEGFLIVLKDKEFEVFSIPSSKFTAFTK